MTFTKRFCISSLFVLTLGLFAVPPAVTANEAVVFKNAAIPDTDAGNNLAAYIEAHNSGDSKAIQAFVTEHYSAAALQERSIPERVPAFVGFYSIAGPLKPFSTTPDGDYAINALVMGEGDGGWYGITITLETEPPHKIAQIAVNAGADPPPSLVKSDPKKTRTEKVALMTAYLERLAAFGYNGSVLVADKNGIILDSAYGFAQVENGIKNHTATLFSTGSVTKQFTAAAIMTLESDLKLKTTDTIGRFIDDVPRDKAGITIHHLLTHTAGLRSHFGPDNEVVGRDEMVRRILEAPLAKPVGVSYDYSNAGYSLLAAIVEKVSGVTWETYLQKRLFRPAGMTQTGLHQVVVDDTLVSHSHNRQLEYASPLDRPRECWNLIGNGGILSTTADMYRWYKVLQGNEILTHRDKNKIFQPWVKEYEGGNSFYGYGWVVDDYGPNTLRYWHNGGAMPHGWSCAVYQYLTDSLVFIVFSNKPIDGIQPVDIIVENLAGILLDREYAMPPRAVPSKRTELAVHEGNYVAGDSAEYRINVEAGHLLIIPKGQAALNSLFPSRLSTYISDYNGKTAEVIRLLARDDFENALAYFHPEAADPQQWEEMIREWWRSFDSLGSYRGFSILGSMPAGGTRTYCEIGFASGNVICRFFWEDGKCSGMVSDVDAPGRILFRRQADSFAGFNFRHGFPVEVTFDDVGSMTVASQNRRLTAYRR